MKVITSNGVEILIDPEDYEKVKRYSWCISKTGYAVANIKGKVTKMHRYILNESKPEIIIDHINRNKLDNRKENLRRCTYKQNSRNTSVSKNNATGYLGISLTAQGKFRARIMVDGKEIRLGNYDNIDEAIKARKQGEKIYFGEYAPVNN